MGGRRLEWMALLAAFAGTWSIELALAERKYGFLGGGFGQSHALAGPAAIVAFATASTLAQAVLLGLLCLLFRRLIRDPARQEERLLAFLFVGVGVASVALAAKLELLGCLATRCRSSCSATWVAAA